MRETLQKYLKDFFSVFVQYVSKFDQFQLRESVLSNNTVNILCL